RLRDVEDARRLGDALLLRSGSEIGELFQCVPDARALSQAAALPASIFPMQRHKKRYFPNPPSASTMSWIGTHLEKGKACCARAPSIGSRSATGARCGST